jgi:hypothetical protein
MVKKSNNKKTKKRSPNKKNEHTKVEPTIKPVLETPEKLLITDMDGRELVNTRFVVCIQYINKFIG